MDAPDATPSPFRFRDSTHQRVYRLLLLIGQGPAIYFRDACRLLDVRAQYDSSGLLISHLFRELNSAVTAVLLPEDFAADDSSESEGKAQHKAKIRAIVTAYSLPDELSKEWAHWANSLHGLAHRDALERPGKAAKALDDSFRKCVRILTAALDQFDARFLNIIPALDALIRTQNPTRKHVKRLKNEMPNNRVTLRYFFDELVGPAWLRPLSAEGFFEHPPVAENDEDGNQYFPFWPASQYLSRVAGDEPDLAAKIAISIPATPNTSVHRDIVRVALAVTPAHASLVIPTICAFLDASPSAAFTMDDLAELVDTLAENNQSVAAVKLAVSLFDVRQEPGTGEDELDSRRALIRGSMHEYARSLRATLERFVRGCKGVALEFLSGLLNRAIEYERITTADDGETDYFYIWCPGIDRQYRDETHKLACCLVGAVSDAAHQLAKDQALTIPAIIGILGKFSWHSFRRIELHLLCSFPDLSEVRNHLLDRQFFDSPSSFPEYVSLLEGQFQSLENENQNKILAWIDGGPDLTAYRKDYTKNEEEVKEYVEDWRFRRLHWCRHALTGKWSVEYSELLKENAAPASPPRYPRSEARFVGDVSPIEAGELGRLDDESILTYLRDWVPTERFEGPSAEGLGEAIRALAKSQPDRFSRLAPRFKSLRGVYASSLLTGLRESANERWNETWWRPIIVLCGGIVKSGGNKVTDDGQRWLRQVVAGLLNVGFSEEKAMFPIALRDSIWEILLTLTQDPDPPAGYSVTSGERFDPITTSINSVRGEAMHAVIRYALWLRRHADTETANLIDHKAGFDAMPEVRQVLEDHLDEGKDGSLAIRAVYGQWLPQIGFLDDGWLAGHVEAIFPHDPQKAQYWIAAWASYVIWAKAYPGVLRHTSPQYEIAISRIGQMPETDNQDPDEALAKHLMVFYWQGCLQLQNDGLVGRFFDRAPPEVRSQAIDFVGRALEETEGDVHRDILERLSVLWEDRLAWAEKNATENASQELTAFGWWFVSAKFEDAWSIEMLKRTLALGRSAEPDDAVAERLAVLAGSFPLLAVECISYLIEADNNNRGLPYWKRHVRTILNAAKGAGAEAWAMGSKLVNRIAATRGMLEFKDLLS